jgi:endonuclease G
VAGGVFDLNPIKIGHGVAVPKATWKIIVPLRTGQAANDVTDSTEVISIIMPNEPGVGQHQWSDYLTSVDEVERETGYDFLEKVPDQIERVIEARTTEAR